MKGDRVSGPFPLKAGRWSHLFEPKKSEWAGTIWDANSGDRCTNPGTHHYMRPNWDFGPDYALNQDEELARSTNKDDGMLT